MRLPFSLFVFCLVLLVGNWSYGKSSKKNHALVNGEGREYSKHNLEPHTYPVKINPRIKTKFFPEKSANHNLYTYASKYDRTASKRRKRDVKTASKKPVCTSEGAFVHPSGCDKFFKCSKAGRKFRMFQFTCEPGTLFNQAKKVCVTVSEAELKLKCQPVAETALKHDVSKVAIDAAAKVQQSKITMKPVIAQNVAEALNAVKVHNVHSTKAPEVHKTDSATAAKVLATSKLTQAHTEQHIDKYFLPHSICTKDGHFVHPNNCTRYYSCRKVGRKFQLFQFDCGATTGAGTIFDEIIGKCVQPGSTNSNCLKTALPEEKVTQESDKVKEKIQEHSVTTSDPTTTTLPPPLEYTTEKIFQSDIVDNAKTHQVSEKVKETLEEGAEGEIKKTITYRNITTIHKLVEIEDYEYAEGSDETGMKTKEIRNFTTAGTRKDVSSKADGETAAKVIATSKLTHAQTKEHADKYFLPRSLCKTEGFFVHPSNCGKYYSCRKVGHRFQLFQFECPAGTIFDDDSDKCMKPESAAAASCLTISTGEIDLHKTITHRNSTTTHILVAGDYEDEESNEQGLSKTRSSRKRTTTATGNEAESNLHKTDSETAAKVLAAGKLTHEHTRQHADKYFLHHSLCKAEGFFVHPSSCGRYYRCRKFGRRFQLFQFECSPGTIFGDDSHSDKCVQPDPTVANCLNVTILETHAGLNATATFRNSSTSHNIVDSDYEYTGSSGERLTKTKASRKSTGSKKMAETEAEAELHSRKATIRNSTTSHTIVDGDYEYTDSSRERLTKTKASQKSAGSRKMAETEAEAGLHSRRATIRNSTTSHTIVGGDYEYTDSSGERLTKTKASRKKSAVATVAEAENHGVGGGLSTAKDISRSAASAVLTNAICKSVGLFPHPSGCHKYYKCDKLGRRFRLFQFDCEPGTFFDEAIGRCDTPQALGETWSCRTGGEEEATVAETFDQIENASKAGRNRRVPVAESGSNKKTTKKTVRKTTSTVVNSAEDYDDDYDEEPHSTTKTTKKTSKSSPSSGSKTVGGGGSTTTRKKTTKKTTTHTVDEGDDEYYDEDEDGDGGSLTKTKSKPSSKSELDASSKNKTHKHIERKSKTGVGESVEDVDVEDSVIGNKKIHRVTSKAVHTEYDDDDYEVEENPKSAKKTKTVKKTTSSHTVLEGEDEYDDSGDADHTVSKTKTARKKVTTSKTTKSEDEDTHGVKDKAKTTAADLLTHRICKAPGLYPHPNGCHKYYKCNSIGKRFTLFQYNCDPGKFFDEVLGHCETREVLGGSWTCKTGDHIADFDASHEVSTKASEVGDDYEDESAKSLAKTKSAPKKSLTSTKTTKTKTSEHEDEYEDEENPKSVKKTKSTVVNSAEDYDDDYDEEPHSTTKTTKKTSKSSTSSGSKTVGGGGSTTTRKKTTKKTTTHTVDEGDDEYYDEDEDGDGGSLTKTKSKPSSKSELDASSKNKTHKHIERKSKTGVGESVEDVDVEDSIIGNKKIHRVTSKAVHTEYDDDDYEDEENPKSAKKTKTVKKTTSSHTVLEGEDEYDDSGDADHTVSKTKTARKKVTTSKTTKSEDEDTHGVKDKAKTTAADLLTHRICKAPGLYPHPNGCHKYYKCNSIGKRFTLFQYNCDPGKFFDEVLGHCETREVLGGSWTCKTGDHGKSTDSTEYLLKNTICKEDGFFTHPKTCEKFYRCTKIGHKFQMFQFDCGPGTIFDDTLHTCVHPSSKDPGWLCKVQEATSIAEFDASQEVSTKASEAGDDYEDESAESLTKTKSAPKKSLTSTKTTKTKTSEHEDDYDDEDSGPGITKTHSAPPRKSTSTSNLTKNTESEDNYDDSGESLSKTHAARKSVKKTVKTTKTVTGHHEYEDISDENGEKTTKKKVTVKKTSTTHHILDEYSGEDGREDNDDTGFTKTTKTIKKSKISKTSHTLIDDYSDEDYEDEHGVKKKRTKKVSTTKKTNSTVIDDWDDSKHKASKKKDTDHDHALPNTICTKDGLFMHPEHCDKYYRCKKAGKKYLLFHFDCEPQNVFDENVRKCVKRDSVSPGWKCHAEDESHLEHHETEMNTTHHEENRTESYLLPRSICKSPGKFVHPRTCSKLYRCAKVGKRFLLYQFDCEDAMVFEESVGKCVDPKTLNPDWTCKSTGKGVDDEHHEKHAIGEDEHHKTEVTHEKNATHVAIYENKTTSEGKLISAEIDDAIILDEDGENGKKTSKSTKKTTTTNATTEVEEEIHESEESIGPGAFQTLPSTTEVPSTDEPRFEGLTTTTSELIIDDYDYPSGEEVKKVRASAPRKTSSMEATPPSTTSLPGGNICEDEGDFDVPGSCTKFRRCLKTSDKFELNDMDCGANQVFDEFQSTCVAFDEITRMSKCSAEADKLKQKAESLTDSKPLEKTLPAKNVKGGTKTTDKKDTDDVDSLEQRYYESLKKGELKGTSKGGGSTKTPTKTVEQVTPAQVKDKNKVEPELSDHDVANILRWYCTGGDDHESGSHPPATESIQKLK